MLLIRNFFFSKPTTSYTTVSVRRSGQCPVKLQPALRQGRSQGSVSHMNQYGVRLVHFEDQEDRTADSQRLKGLGNKIKRLPSAEEHVPTVPSLKRFGENFPLYPGLLAP